MVQKAKPIGIPQVFLDLTVQKANRLRGRQEPCCELDVHAIPTKFLVIAGHSLAMLTESTANISNS